MDPRGFFRIDGLRDSCFPFMAHHASRRNVVGWVAWANGEGLTDIVAVDPGGTTNPGMGCLRLSIPRKVSCIL